MEIKQTRNSNRIRFEFGVVELGYTVRDGSGSRTFSVPYANISRDRQTLEERNEWLRNVGLLWLALGAVFTLMSSLDKAQLVPSIWLLIGPGCYAVYRLRATRFPILPSDNGNILIVDNAEGPRITREIDSRCAQQLPCYYNVDNPEESPEQRPPRHKWLHRERALTDEALECPLAAAEQPGSPGAQPDVGAGQVHN